MAGGLLLLLLDNNFITLFIVAGMLLAIVACLRLNELKTYEQKQIMLKIEIIIAIFIVVDTLLAIALCCYSVS